MTTNQTIYTVAAALLTLLSCSKTVQSPRPDDTGETVPIAFGIVPQWPEEGAQTKALLDKSSLCSDGNVLRICDVITGWTDPLGVYHARDKYIEWPFKYGDSDWLRCYEDDPSSAAGGHYYWTSGGVHKFFAWTRLVDGVDATSLFTDYLLGTTQNPSRLDIRETTLTTESPQIDFLYTDAVTRSMDVTPKDYSAVPLTFHHLFAALSVSIVNNTTESLDVRSLSITGLKNKAPALITFYDAQEVGVNYNPQNVDGDFVTSAVTGLIPAKSAVAHSLDAFSRGGPAASLGVVDAAGSEPRFIWPQTIGSGSEAVSVTLTYSSGGSAQSSKTYTLSNAQLIAGKKYRLNIVYNGDNAQITGSLTVLPWTYDTYAVDLEVRGDALVFPDTYSLVSNTLTIRPSDTDIRGTFTPVAPQGGTWFVGLEGDGSEYFTLSHDSANGTVDGGASGPIDGQTVTLILTPKTVDSDGVPLDRHNPHSVTLHFGILSGNLQFDATSVLNPNGYIITLPAID